MSKNLSDVCAKVYQRLASGQEIRLEDRAELGLSDVSIEEILNELLKAYGLLLHGSRNKISAGDKLHIDSAGKAYATDNSAIAILKANFSNKHADNLSYPYFISDENPLALTIFGGRPGVEGQRGYVYILNSSNGFINTPLGSWQWITEDAENTLGGCIEVERSDFHYPVYMVNRASSETSLRPLRYSLSEEYCDSRYVQALQIKVTEVLGSSSTVVSGEAYLVRGEYMLAEPGVAGLRLLGQGCSSGCSASVSPGSGKFEVTAEIMEVIAGSENILDLLMADKEGAELGVRVRIELE